MQVKKYERRRKRRREEDISCCCRGVVLLSMKGERWAGGGEGVEKEREWEGEKEGSW